MRQLQFVFFFLISLLVTALSTIAQDSVKDSLLFEELKQKAEWMYKSNELLSVNHGVHYMAIDLTENYEFCIEENKDWYVIESTLKDGKFDFNQTHYDLDLKDESTSHFTDTTLKRYVKSLQIAHQALLTANDTLDFLWENHILKQSDSIFEVIFVPAFQPSGQAIYGISLNYVVNALSQKIISSRSHYSGIKTLWIGQPRIVWLNYRTETDPEIGGVYFAFNYKDYFTKTYLDLKDKTYLLQKDEAGVYGWTVKYK